MTQESPINFQVGDKVDIGELTEEQAVAIFGAPFYYAWKNGETIETEFIISDVDLANNTITLGYPPEVH